MLSSVHFFANILGADRKNNSRPGAKLTKQHHYDTKVYGKAVKCLNCDFIANVRKKSSHRQRVEAGLCPEANWSERFDSPRAKGKRGRGPKLQCLNCKQVLAAKSASSTRPTHADQHKKEKCPKGPRWVPFQRES
jgi:ribosomal protein S26